jgi:hypothetical protein
VCGEFLSPETEAALARLGVRDQFFALKPAPMRRMLLCFGKRERQAEFAEQAWGFSRYALDRLLLEAAVQRGAEFTREAPEPAPRPLIVATGRKAAGSRRGSRLFGFKAHFRGPFNDAVELYFFASCYAGVSPVEGGLTNVCGLAPEWLLRDHNFDVDRVLALSEPLRERLRPLNREWKWLNVGPLVFQNHFRFSFEPHVYPAGDLLSFVDPFTGSGILSAILTGTLAGAAAARGEAVENYIADCRKLLGRPFRISSLFRHVLASGLAPRLAPLVPPNVLFRLTRPARL